MEALQADMPVEPQAQEMEIFSRHEDGYDVYDVLMVSAGNPEVAASWIKTLKCEELDVSVGGLAAARFWRDLARKNPRRYLH